MVSKSFYTRLVFHSFCLFVLTFTYLLVQLYSYRCWWTRFLLLSHGSCYDDVFTVKSYNRCIYWSGCVNLFWNVIVIKKKTGQSDWLTAVTCQNKFTTLSTSTYVNVWNSSWPMGKSIGAILANINFILMKLSKRFHSITKNSKVWRSYLGRKHMLIPLLFPIRNACSSCVISNILYVHQIS